MRRRGVLGQRVLLVGTLMSSLVASACTTIGPKNSGNIAVVAAERQWGSIVAQVGGPAVTVTNVIASPTIDPHAYEPTPRDANAIAVANYVVENGLGYDAWMTRLVAATGHEVLVRNVGQQLGLSMGANPHRWYSPSDVATITMVIADDLSALRPTQRVQFHQRAQRFLEVTLATYTATRRRITDQFAHTPVGASESIFSPLVAELSLNLATPARFLRSVSEGGEPTARDLSVITDQIRHHRIAVYLENVQNITPAVAEQVTLARSVSPPIPVVAMTETPPVHQSFARWQTRQLRVLFAALKEAHP